MRYKKALFSGRFDPPHLGHVITVKRILSIYADKVAIVLLDYPERRFSVNYCLQVFKSVFVDYDEISIISNQTHFGKITKEELLSYSCDCYCGGNLVVNRHLERLSSIPIIYMERAFEYEASKYEFPS